MCWKYEDEYSVCWDTHYRYNDSVIPTESLLESLADIFGIYVVDVEAFKEKWYDFCTDLHENKIIRPCTEEEEKQYYNRFMSCLQRYWAEIDELKKRVKNE